MPQYDRPATNGFGYGLGFVYPVVSRVKYETRAHPSDERVQYDHASRAPLDGVRVSHDVYDETSGAKAGAQGEVLLLASDTARSQDDARGFAGMVGATSIRTDFLEMGTHRGRTFPAKSKVVQRRVPVQVLGVERKQRVVRESKQMHKRGDVVLDRQKAQRRRTGHALKRPKWNADGRDACDERRRI